MHDGDDGHRTVPDRLEHARHLLRAGDVLIEAQLHAGLHPLEVGAGAERTALAAQDDEPCAFVRGNLVEDGLEFADHPVVEGITALWPIQGHGRDTAIIKLDADRLVSLTHRSLP